MFSRQNNLYSLDIATRSNAPSDRTRCAYIRINDKQDKNPHTYKKEPLGGLQVSSQGSMVTVLFPLYLISFLAAFVKVCSTNSRLPP